MLTALKWLGTGAQVVGVFLLASRAVPPSVAYVVMLAGSAIWTGVATRIREPSMVALNLAFTASNLLGLWQWSRP